MQHCQQLLLNKYTWNTKGKVRGSNVAINYNNSKQLARI